MNRFSIVVLLAVWPGVLLAETRPPQEFRVSLASSPIVVDGRLEEAAWQQAIPIPVKYELEGSGFFATPLQGLKARHSLVFNRAMWQASCGTAATWGIADRRWVFSTPDAKATVTRTAWAASMGSRVSRAPTACAFNGLDRTRSIQKP